MSVFYHSSPETGFGCVDKDTEKAWQNLHCHSVLIVTIKKKPTNKRLQIYARESESDNSTICRRIGSLSYF